MTRNTRMIDQSEGVNIRLLILGLIKKWYWLLGAGVLGMMVGLAYIKIAPRKYAVSTTLLVTAEVKNEFISSVFSEGAFDLASNNIENEVGILKSYLLNHKTVRNLKWETSIYEEGFFSDIDLYLNEPFKVIKEKSKIQIEGVPIYIEILSDQKYRVTVDDEVFIRDHKISVKVNQTATFGESLKTKYFHFRIQKIEGKPLIPGTEYSIVFNNLNALTDSNRERLKIDLGEEGAKLIYITLVSAQPSRDINYLNELGSNYIDYGLTEKNKVIDNTLRFINSQIVGITDSLEVASEDFTNFRSENRIFDIGQEASMVVESLENLEREEAGIRMRLEYYKNLQSYLSDAGKMKELVAPSVMGIADASLNGLVVKLSELYGQREVLSYTVQEENPNLVSLKSEIKYTQKILNENIENLLSNTYAELSSLNSRKDKINSVLAKLPEKEQDLVNIKRSFDLNNELYTFLLEKRAEMGIARASNSPDAKVLDKARLDSAEPVGPSHIQVILIGLMVGIGLTASIFIFLDYIDTNIGTIEDIESGTFLPISASIYSNKYASELPVVQFPNSVVTESFRILRTNLFHILDNEIGKVIAVNSFLVGEGKTFVAANLAATLALNNKKVLLVEADLKRPRLHAIFKVDRGKGLSSYLAKKSKMEDIIVATRIKNLHFVASGPTSQFTSELLSNGLLDLFIRQAKESYDYVILDSVPIGILSDALILSKHADHNLVVVRVKVSGKSQLAAIEKLTRDGSLNHVSLIANDLPISSSKGDYKEYGYG